MQTIKMTTTNVVKGEDGKLYAKLSATEAVKNENPVRGQVGDGEKAKYAFYEEIKATT